MTDKQYFECYSVLVERLAAEHELDRDVFYSIFEGKIKPIIRNVYSEYTGTTSSIDLEDLYQDIFIKLWTRAVSAYFMNDKYETSASWFLGWCKIVIKNHITSVFRKRSMRSVETLDDPDHPVNVADSSDPSSGVSLREAVASVFRNVMDLPSKNEMKLVWFSVYALVYSGEAEDRIEANHIFLERFSDKSGEEIAGAVSSFLESVGDVDLAGRAGDLSAGVGERFSDLLGDDPLAKISDWIYKINKKLKEILPSEVVEWNT